MTKGQFTHALSWAVVALVLLCGHVQGSVHGSMLWCKACVPLRVHDAPGVGFDIGFSYGTSAVLHYNGTVLSVAKLPASAEFTSLLLRLASSPAPSPPTPLERYRRWLNKKLGLPATPAVGVLSTLIFGLRAATAAAYPLLPPLDRVALSAPLMPALTSEDLVDALEYAGLRPWIHEQLSYLDQLAPSRMLYAAGGRGVCPTYRDPIRCLDEEFRMPEETIYTVTFTHHALYLALDTVRAAFDRFNPREPFRVVASAGLDTLAEYPSSAAFWAHVRAQLADFPQFYRPRATDFQVAGDCVETSGFTDALRDGLRDGMAWVAPRREGTGGLGEGRGVKGGMPDPVFGAARGAALYARRRQEVPLDCRERPACEDERRRQRERVDPEPGEL